MCKFKKITMMLAVMLGLLFTVGVSAYFPKKASAYAMEQEKAWGYGDCENLISFIEENLETFVSEYNNTVSDGNYLSASMVEFSSVINLVEDNNYGVYIDFDNDNGYLVATGDYNIYELQVEGDLDYLRTEKNIWYSYLDGFLYMDDAESLQRFIDPEEKNALSAFHFRSENVLSNQSNQIYEGQSEAGDGEIDPTKIKDYVADRYPDYQYVTHVQKLSSTFTYTNQFNSSYYRKSDTDKDGNVIGFVWSEGNCVLNSMYSLINNWSDCGYLTNIPKTTDTMNVRSRILSEALYEVYGRGIVRSGSSTSKSTASSGDTEVAYYKWEVNYATYVENMPKLYSEIRNYAVDVKGYTPESGYNIGDVPSTIQYVTNTLHKNSITIKTTSSISDVLTYVENGKACYMSINGSSTYGNHGVSLIGYYKYSYKSGWWIFSSTKYAYFYEIADNWTSASSKFFDPNTDASPTLKACYLV